MSAVSFLIVDPSQALQTFVRQLLGSHGFDAAAIKTAGNPQAAAEIAASLKPDFLLTDWYAKESLTGIGLYQDVLKTSPGCRFALLSRTAGPSEMREAEQAGALFLLGKPFSADALRHEMGRALEQLAKLHPSIAQQLSAHGNASQAEAQIRAAKLQMSSLPQYKPGDRVMYANRVETVKNVILRRGDLVVQLHGIPGMVETTKITRL